ncbi:PP2C family protein-serine/threonine phosphatase [Oceanobacillus jeddahense]|uniref:PP2C family protein-serine/threonine phosphatase n=1 Tax=Oceanobacillus jeddahense TaxID=1462527 RepID=A0ABY5JWI9_9BACI|nr:PP2C family protein-serine/threonine phosphatase [Oceanobacillus jeddahense]UUI04165.1 PP2C family protein-serine/threonine phosphatase [Oceanobacillus jeddahense]
MKETIEKNSVKYQELLQKYIETQDEKALYDLELISKAFIKKNILPEELINLHIQAMERIYPQLMNEYKLSMEFLLEATIFYGLALQEMDYLRQEKDVLTSEISVAANMQKTLLGTKKPEVNGLDIGVISVPAHQMNGDYHHFTKGSNGTIGIAIADVIGKGIPAALCMSMIKYAMDSYPEATMSPNKVLENLNRVVERNIDSSMFITMCYAHYLPKESKLRLSSAGHEPGYIFRSETGEFEEVRAKGIVLGVMPDAQYREYELDIDKDDLIIFLTDGVSECRDGERFIETEELLEVIRKYTDLPAQDLVDNVYQYFEKLQDFQLRDDFTLIVLRKEV